MVSGRDAPLPLLASIYFSISIIIEQWPKKCQPFGVDILYKCGGTLVGERTRRPLTTTATQLQFADDAALVGSSREQIKRAALILDEVAAKCGLTVSLHKTKLLVVAGNAMKRMCNHSLPEEHLLKSYHSSNTWAQWWRHNETP